MKVKILEAAFFNNVYYKKGAIVELNIKKCPSWAEVVEIKTTKTKIEDKKNESKKEDLKPVFNETNEEAKKEKLEELLNLAFEKDILLEGTENMTVEEQIKKLEELLEGK